LLVRAIGLESYRNLAPLVLEPGPGFNVFAGDNGQGKTNLLEALYLIGTLRSFRTSRSEELIAHGAPQAELRARVEAGGLERHYEVVIGPRKRELLLDGKTPRQLADYFGGFNVVLFAPEDLRVPRDAPAGRRRFLDRTVFTRQPSFLAEAQRYARVLRSRNALLKSERVDLAQLEVYDQQLAVAGARVVVRRREVLAELAPLLEQAFTAISGAGERATPTAQVRIVGAQAEVPEDQLGEALLHASAASRGKDLARRTSSVGPHADDLEFLLAERPARAFASQGQLRALVLAWKIAEISMIRAANGEAPVLLLDDVSSELDRGKNQRLFDFLAGAECQCFITTTHAEHVLARENRKDYQVVEGRISPS
jgi:DNA replication and repair protein RecF